jgi:hypothetical protein
MYVLPAQFGVPGGPELFFVIALVVQLVFALVALIVPFAALYLLYKIRQDVSSMASSLARIAERETK